MLKSNFSRLLPVYVVVVIWSTSSSVSVNGPVMPLFAETVGIGIIGWSLLVASAGLGMLSLEWAWGSYYDKFDRRLLMILSVACMTVLYPLYSLHALIPYFAILQFLSGALGVALGPLTRACVSNESPAESVGLFTSLWWGSSILGSVVGPLLGTFIAQTWSFEYSFYASALLSLLAAPLILITFPKRRKTPRSSQTLASGLKSVLTLRLTGFLFLSTLFTFMGKAAILSFLPIYASDQIRMSTLEVGLLMSATSAAQLTALTFGLFSDRFGRKRMVLLGFGLSSLAFPFFFIASSPYELALVSIFVFMGFSVSSLLLLSLVREVAPATLYGTAVGVYGSFEDVGFILGPAAFGFIWSTYGPVSIFAAAALTQILGALFLLPIIRRR